MYNLGSLIKLVAMWGRRPTSLRCQRNHLKDGNWWRPVREEGEDFRQRWRLVCAPPPLPGAKNLPMPWKTNFSLPAQRSSVLLALAASSIWIFSFSNSAFSSLLWRSTRPWLFLCRTRPLPGPLRPSTSGWHPLSGLFGRCSQRRSWDGGSSNGRATRGHDTTSAVPSGAIVAVSAPWMCWTQLSSSRLTTFWPRGDEIHQQRLQWTPGSTVSGWSTTQLYWRYKTIVVIRLISGRLVKL